MNVIDFKANGWRLRRVVRSYWGKTEGNVIEGKFIPLCLIFREMESEITGEVKSFWEITSPKNPLPVKGMFESSYDVLRRFLVTNGFHVDGSKSRKEQYFIYK